MPIFLVAIIELAKCSENNLPFQPNTGWFSDVRLKLMECEKTENRKNQYFKEFNKMKLFKANLFIWNVITYYWTAFLLNSKPVSNVDSNVGSKSHRTWFTPILYILTYFPLRFYNTLPNSNY